MNLKPKIKLCLILLIPVLFLSAVLFCRGCLNENRAETADLFYRGLENTCQITAYRYNLEADLYLKNGSTAQTALTGARDSHGNLHILGKLTDTELEAYQIGNTHYRFRSVDKIWDKQTDSPLPDNPLLITLIDPLVNLQFTDTVAVDFKEKTHSNGETRYWFRVTPKEGYHIADAFYRDFRCTVAVDKKNEIITDAIITAAARTEAESKLKINVHFFDINGDFAVTPPEH